MKTFLIEIGTEEIPARYISKGLGALKEKFEEFFSKSYIEYGKITGYATPRRLALLIEDIAEKQQDREVEIIGPPKKVRTVRLKWEMLKALLRAENHEEDKKNRRRRTL